jgi:hypothetical protein
VNGASSVLRTGNFYTVKYPLYSIRRRIKSKPMQKIRQELYRVGEGGVPIDPVCLFIKIVSFSLCMCRCRKGLNRKISFGNVREDRNGKGRQDHGVLKKKSIKN